MTKTKTPFQIYVQRLKNHKENKVKNFHKEHKYRTIMKVPVRERERERERGLNKAACCCFLCFWTSG
jgi:hypothetical protein